MGNLPVVAPKDCVVSPSYNI
ncbi:hypothetical protein PLAN_100098 [Planktothrix rubescens CCAP 1459/22]|uniref:Uncharacterized protein n=1 Tax=Planktothrix rubescens CCAP 1459/22 TaxID=329571 RepID=A0A6J7ZEK7_PLARU|nr:hypothetical protein PLAN_100098 [Planktothrix rubescens NIVA-CYA 18]